MSPPLPPSHPVLLTTILTTLEGSKGVEQVLTVSPIHPPPPRGVEGLVPKG